MTWIDKDGEVRPQSWEEFCEMEARTRCLPYWMVPKRGFNYHPQSSRKTTPHVKKKTKTPKREVENQLRMRIRLFRADPHCFWCGIKVVLDKKAERWHNFATVDHLYSRWHPERKARHVEGRGVLHVLACSSCNGERAGCEVQQQPFIPKLPERLEFARLADATLARNGAVKQLEPSPLPVLVQPQQEDRAEPPKSTMRVICTLQEAVEFAKENPAR